MEVKALLKNPWEIVLAGLIILIIVSSALTAIGAKDARIQFLNAVADSGPLDVYEYGILIASNIELGAMSDYARLSANSYDFQVLNTGTNGPVLSDFILPLGEKTDYTVILTGKIGAIDRIWLGRDRQSVQGQQARLRVAHADPSLGVVDVSLNGDAPLFTNVDYLENRGFVTLPSGTYDFVVKSSADGSVLFDVPSQELTRGGQYTAVLVGGPIKSLVLYEDTTNVWKKTQVH